MLFSPARFFGIFFGFWAIMALALTAIVHLLPEAWWQLAPYLVDWDAEHYNTIRECGYNGNLTYIQAFFPLFPLVWRWTGLETYGACVMNILVFGASLFWLWRTFQWQDKWLPLYLSTPILLFMALPYTEAFFFAASVALLIGLQRKNLWLTCIAMLLCSLTRPTFTILLPALYGVEILSESNWRTLLMRCSLYTLAAGIGTATVVLLQHADTGMWFGYIEAQKYWGHRLMMPKLPLKTWGKGDMLTSIITRIDGAGILFGAISLVALAGLGIRRLRLGAVSTPRPLLCAMLYCVGLSLSLLMFKGGTINSIARYIFATAYFLVIIQYAWTHYQPSARQVGLAFLALLAFFIGIFGGTSHIRLILSQGIAAAHMTLWVAAFASPKWLQRTGYALSMGVNILMMLYLMWQFLHHQWVE